ncbi:DUF2141 domain-containing protein [Stutzerimonas kirkiae]|uniref:DUF2141 domain-containing protein n=1 Tax=Stutzerimonas kirkiae TaxID=2211392 RepID=A0A4Q9R304_9GAMM|nr:DUF2141 domain-containing protein [Stutzerimonas kirkiae]TBU92821.1 hypothetical protein DNJ96_14520 [Stutzerimonas kirkiae]TBV01284.1 hypothetical protein DNJ95_12465 [Stutzerimonas kirkiae]TBV10743.1 hypothetical protein DNK08_05360 [Stutzerimonas kirkiae]TBV14535.1 hypothetical protein DNK01_08210 [Stutzerimonas kirkiae]
MKAIVALLLPALFASGPVFAEDVRLSVVVHGLQHERGSVRASLYNDPDSFRKEARAVAVRQVSAVEGDAVIHFDGLAPGRYALMVYHDENADGKLNLRLGMFPREGYGLSNNPRVMGPPKFEASAFDVSGPETTTDIDVRY